MISDLAIPSRVKFTRLYYGLVLVALFIRWKNQMLLSQLEQPELTYLGTDITYIFLVWSGITHFLANHHWASFVFDVSLIGSALGSFILPNQRISNIVFTTLLGIYIVVGYSFLCFHKHNLTGLWFASLMFLAISPEGFKLSFELVRLYCLLSYTSAGFWKFFRDVWDAKGHFLTIVKNDALGYLVQHPFSLLSQIISWFITHPGLLDVLMTASCFFQLLFIVGVFTKRLDWFFFIYALSFHLLSLLLLRAYFMEFSVILITLLPLPILYRANRGEGIN